MAPNQNPAATPARPGQAELVVTWYSQKLAAAQEENANLWAQNYQLTERVKELTAPVDPNVTAKGSDA